MGGGAAWTLFGDGRGEVDGVKESPIVVDDRRRALITALLGMIHALKQGQCFKNPGFLFTWIFHMDEPLRSLELVEKEKTH
jgi:hypothetical protein